MPAVAILRSVCIPAVVMPREAVVACCTPAGFDNEVYALEGSRPLELIDCIVSILHTFLTFGTPALRGVLVANA